MGSYDRRMLAMAFKFMFFLLTGIARCVVTDEAWNAEAKRSLDELSAHLAMWVDNAV